MLLKNFMSCKKIVIVLVGIFIIIGIACINRISQAESVETKNMKDEYNGLKISIQTNKDSYLVGEKIQVTFVFSNTSSREIIISSPVLGAGCLGLVSRTYKEGNWNINSRVSGNAILVIPAGKDKETNYEYTAEEFGNPTVVAYFYSAISRDFTPDEKNKYNINSEGNWFGKIVATKTVEVKKEIHPDMLKAINEAENLFYTLLNATSGIDKRDEEKRVMGKFTKIGFPAKDALLKLFTNPVAQEYKDSITRALLNLSYKAFDEQLYKEVINRACDPTVDMNQRLYFMEIWWNPDWRMQKDDRIRVFSNDFLKWSFEQLGQLKQDKNREIKDKADEILGSYKELLDGLGLSHLFNDKETPK
ncbi:MAG: hypothetical protein WC980_10670 [Candidatus Brocadiia bacterium]